MEYTKQETVVNADNMILIPGGRLLTLAGVATRKEITNHFVGDNTNEGRKLFSHTIAQMKFVLLLLGSILLLTASCGKAAEDVVDCVAEGVVTSFSHTPDGTNPKLINFQVSYSGSNTVSSVLWEFGDGSSATVTTLGTAHTYATAGTYPVKAKVTIRKASSNCTVEPTKNVTVN